MLIGHPQAQLLFFGELPRLSLFHGPDSVGKWTAASEIAYQRKLNVWDVQKISRLTAETAREINTFAFIAPYGDCRICIVNLKDATNGSLNSLLKTLEEAPLTSKFIFISESPTIDTITSRAQVVEFGLLSEAQVSQILVSRKFSKEGAKTLAALSGGQVIKALAASELNDIKPDIIILLKAFREHSPNALEGLATRWTEAHTELLQRWCVEAVSQRWKLFTEEESYMPSRGVPLKVLAALRADVRPRLVVRHSLMTVLKGI